MKEGGRYSFALLGDPVAHSVSPAIHEAAFRVMGVDATYVALRVAAGDVEAVVQRFAVCGGGNITLPHKRRVAALLERRTEDVTETGACNCFWSDSRGRLYGDNTDVGGFLATLEHLFSLDLGGARVLLLGAGGAGRAVFAACQQRGALLVDILNRTVARAEELSAEVRENGPAVRALAHESDLRPGYDLIVNATRLGLSDSDPLPLDLAGFEACAVLDLVYGLHGTRWTRHAAALGFPAADGLDMLVRQAALSLRRWFPDTEPPIPVMTAAADRALGYRRPGGDTSG